MHNPYRLPLLVPALAVALLGSASVVGCFGRAVTLGNEGELSGDAGWTDFADEDATDHTKPVEDSGPNEPHFGDGMVVDGITCTGVTANVTTQTAPDGRTWILDLEGSCGVLGVVEAFITSKDNVAYPHTCANVGFVRASIGAEGDAGQLAYDSSDTLGSCTIMAGPSTADQTTQVAINAVVENASGKTHTLHYSTPSAPPPGMSVDGITCTGVTSSVTPQTAPDGKTWTLSMKGKCGGLLEVSAFVASKDDIAYPQSCGASAPPRIDLRVQAGGDAGTGYVTDTAGGSCAILSGPSVGNQQSPVRLTATVVNGFGQARKLVITP